MINLLLISRPFGLEWIFVLIYVACWIFLFREVIGLVNMPDKGFIYKLVWLLILFSFPVLGLAAYNLVNSTQLKKDN
ncbi:hypothetical protein [Flavihumibacter petaseus]|uniref:Uncharacterized protein n=1 Tax=Flavihumibacter petaseus NBRC 106054 TaxID=1220578 RepID=A0A0E9N056_9BACT|nr:hypothetical protein [Flavihumibacter petaseus]GAO43006.1 hypothetical protein FPE01S_02_01110 [Flavihumibacter petaseus NBRC 106054]